jgi:hypothetical protein
MGRERKRNAMAHKIGLFRHKFHPIVSLSESEPIRSRMVNETCTGGIILKEGGNAPGTGAVPVISPLTNKRGLRHYYDLRRREAPPRTELVPNPVQGGGFFRFLRLRLTRTAPSREDALSHLIVRALSITASGTVCIPLSTDRLKSRRVNRVWCRSHDWSGLTPGPVYPQLPT